MWNCLNVNSGFIFAYQVHNKNVVVSFKTSPEQTSDTEIQQEHQEFADATKEGQAFIDITSEEKQITPGLSATQYESTETKGMTCRLEKLNFISLWLGIV